MDKKQLIQQIEGLRKSRVIGNVHTHMAVSPKMEE